jgi:osmoprotectant transport system substrate-binding protein
MKTGRTVLVVLVAVALAAAGCGDDDDTSDRSSTVRISAQGFGESAVLAEIYEQALDAAGYDVDVVKLDGFRDVEVRAFEKGTINFAPEYAASMLEFLNDKSGEASGDVDLTVQKLRDVLAGIDLVALEVSEAVDTNAFVVTRATASRLGLVSLSDLAAKGGDLTLGGPGDCATNPFCIPGLVETYGVDLSDKFRALETGEVAPALDEGTIDVGLLFSTDGRIQAKHYVLLEDDHHMLAADNILPVVSAELAKSADFVAAVNEITAALTTDKLIAMNKRFDIDEDDAADIAEDFLTEAGLD